MSDVLPFFFSFPEDGKNTPKYNGACIYLICSPDGTPYVGQTKKFCNRMQRHKSDGKRAWITHAKYQAGKSNKKVAAISFAINKHGWENLEIIILRKYFVWDQLFLDKREQYFIRFYDSFKNGYNCNEGGNRNKGPTKHTEETKAKMSKPVTSCEIKESYSDGTQLVKFVQYPSAREAEAETRVDFRSISDCCLKKQKTAGGFFWFFSKENHPPQIMKVGTIQVPYVGDKPPPYRRAVFSESPRGEKQLHEGGSAAKRTLSKATGKKFSHSNISACCSSKHKQTHHHGFKFWYASDEEIAEFEKEASKKRKRK